MPAAAQRASCRGQGDGRGDDAIHPEIQHLGHDAVHLRLGIRREEDEDMVPFACRAPTAVPGDRVELIVQIATTSR